MTTEQAQHPGVVWHDLECGGYRADLPLWRELADEAAARAGGEVAAVLDIGAGTGRVALDLAARGHRVSAVEIDGELARELHARAASAPAQDGGQPRVAVIEADARRLADHAGAAGPGERRFDLCVMPMQTIQLFGGAAARAACLRAVRGLLSPGGVVACAIVEELDEFDTAAGDGGPTAERVRLGDRDYTSRALRVAVGVDTIVIERAREMRSPSGHLDSERDVVTLDRLGSAQLAGEGEAVGLRALGVRTIPATADHVGSAVVVLGA